jgi:hypothetical protein
VEIYVPLAVEELHCVAEPDKIAIGIISPECILQENAGIPRFLQICDLRDCGRESVQITRLFIIREMMVVHEPGTYDLLVFQGFQKAGFGKPQFVIGLVRGQIEIHAYILLWILRREDGQHDRQADQADEAGDI